jgi:phosphatidylglycerol---prolipoprotein diacylglyceryl transferase
MLIHWSVSPEIFEIGPVRLRWYGLMFLTGFTIGYQLMREVCLKEDKPVEKLESLLIYLVLATMIGARLGHCLFYDPGYYLAHPLDILKVYQGGLASHGGGLGVITALILFSRRNPEFSMWWLLDRISIFTVMTGALIRIGNLMNSEILGKPTDGSWGVIFSRVDQVPRHPAMIYESICYMFIFALTYTLYRKWRARSPDGLLFGMVVGLIMICRFFIEFFKEVQEPFERGMVLNMGQLLSLPFIAVSLYLVVRGFRRLGQVDVEPPLEKSRKKRKPKRR